MRHKKINVIKLISYLIILVLFYSVVVEPSLLVVRNFTVNEKDTKNQTVVNLVQITDTQIGYFYNIKKLDSMIKKVNSLKPDIVVFTGDLIDSANKEPDLLEITKNLKNIESNIGKFSVFGNHDYRKNREKVYENIMEQAGFRLLINENERISIGNDKFINIIGLDEILLGKPNFNVLENLNKDEFNLLLMHEPDVIDRILPNKIDLMLSGHSHGGQVRIPVKGALATPPYGRKYTKGFYNINGNKLYVSSGLGSTKLPFRLCNVPEIVKFKIFLN